MKFTDIWQKESQWVLDRLQEMSFYYPIALSFIKNLKRVWRLKGNYWDSVGAASGDNE
jgi:hypothetical protein